LGKGAKIAIGCFIAAAVVGVVVMTVFVGGLWWVKDKAQKYVGDVTAKTEEIARYEKQASRNPFTPPADGVIQEAQLVSFLTVRKEIYAVYLQHKPEFDSLADRTKDKKDLNFSETVEAGTLLASLAADVRLVQMKALAAAAMSETEYRYIQQAVYMSAWAGEFDKEAGYQPSEHITKMVETDKQALQAGQEALKKVQEAGGVPGARPLTDEEVKGGQEVLDELGKKAKSIEVPRANIQLFRKYEADIKKYAMTGLVAFGL
jgi:hypothetical protein